MGKWICCLVSVTWSGIRYLFGTLCRTGRPELCPSNEGKEHLWVGKSFLIHNFFLKKLVTIWASTESNQDIKEQDYRKVQTKILYCFSDRSKPSWEVNAIPEISRQNSLHWQQTWLQFHLSKHYWEVRTLYFFIDYLAAKYSKFLHLQSQYKACKIKIGNFQRLFEKIQDHLANS